ncbi:MAG: hypothetical protein H6579_06850 [Chitinophagales bacterium]|nr:hypothetical protein [Bacteroidota bacterium]MCB9256829.1 hypothetical protein [Chitinophagales bacterium]
MTALRFRLDHIKCIEETNEVGSDEPVVLVFIGSKFIFGNKRFQGSKVVRYGPFNNTDKGERKPAQSIPRLEPFFDTSSFAVDPSFTLEKDFKYFLYDFFIIVALIEHDASSLNAITTEVRNSLGKIYAERTTDGQDIDTGGLIEELRSEMSRAIKRKTNNFWVNDDEIINIKHASLDFKTGIDVISEAIQGRPQIISFTGPSVFRGDGGKYEVHLSLIKED